MSHKPALTLMYHTSGKTITSKCGALSVVAVLAVAVPDAAVLTVVVGRAQK